MFCPYGYSRPRVYLDNGNFVILLRATVRTSLKISALLISACFIFSWGCAGKNQQAKETDMQKITINTSLDSSFQLMHDQTAIIESEDLSVKFANVSEDSRCPVGVVCVWPGQAKIELEIIHNDKEPAKITLTSLTGQEKLAEKDVDGYSIRLLEVKPPRTPEQELTFSDYHITLDVSKSR